jgi:anti-anti-sigma factor
MKHNVENGKLIIYFEGELNSYNSEEVEKEIEQIISSSKFDALVLDMEHLSYISSAGLRIIVRLKQQHDDVTVTKVSSDVFDIFDMVGFQNLVKIERL